MTVATALLALLTLAPQGDVQSLTDQGIQQLREAEAAAASGSLSGLEIVDAFVAASNTLRKACAMDGARPEAFVAWSEALLNASDMGNALRAVEAGLSKYSRHPEVLMQLGRVHTAAAGQAGGEEDQRQGWTSAADAYARAAEIDPSKAAPWIRLGEVQVYLGDREEAQKAWKTALEREEAAVDLNNMIGWLQSDAVPLLEGMLARRPDDTTVLWYLGIAEVNAQPSMWKEARAHFERILELNPAFTNTYYYLGQGAMSEGQRLAAQDETGRAKELYAYSAMAWSKYLADFGVQQIQGMASTPDGGQGFVDTMKWLGGQAYEAQDLETAVALAGWVAQARPNDVEAWNNLAFFQREAAHYEESLAAYRRADELQPDDPQIMNDLAVILHYYLRRDDEEARSLYQRAIERGEELLADPSGMDEAEVERLRIGLRDARNNLRRLDAGAREDGGPAGG